MISQRWRGITATYCRYFKAETTFFILLIGLVVDRFDNLGFNLLANLFKADFVGGSDSRTTVHLAYALSHDGQHHEQEADDCH